MVVVGLVLGRFPGTAENEYEHEYEHEHENEHENEHDNAIGEKESRVAACYWGKVGLKRLRPAGGRRYVRPMDSAVDRISSTIETVVTRFRTMVHSVGVRRGLIDADLDEVVQEVRIRLWHAGNAGKVLDELGSSYVYQVATTAALDVLRRRRAHAADRTENIDERSDLTTRNPSPQDDVEASELAAQIEAAVETLLPERRVAVRFHLTGYDRADIARALGWSEAKTRNLLYRGLDDVRQRLAAQGITPRKAR